MNRPRMLGAIRLLTHWNFDHDPRRPLPLSAVFVTVKTAGAVRSSRVSKQTRRPRHPEADIRRAKKVAPFHGDLRASCGLR
jgi:hypothetical protein